MSIIGQSDPLAALTSAQIREIVHASVEAFAVPPNGRVLAIIPDATHGVWLANLSDTTVTHIAFADPAHIATSAQTITDVQGCCSNANVWIF